MPFKIFTWGRNKLPAKDESVSLFFKILPCKVEQNGAKGSRMNIILYYFPR